uniref:Uncharacterized protein n=1 Tax=Arundo donax TaxID=35708 RepID=A0A0A9GT91_ARUDO
MILIVRYFVPKKKRSSTVTDSLHRGITLIN